MKKASQTRCLTFAPYAWGGEVYAQRCDAMRAGTSRYPLHRPTTTYYLCCIRYAVFLYLQNLYLPTSKRCIKMGIPSLIQPFCIVLVFISNFISIDKPNCHFERISHRHFERVSYCHFERVSYCHFFRWCSSGKPITSERSESRNLNHVNITNIPNSRPRKPPFSWTARVILRSHPRKQSFLWTGCQFFIEYY